MTKQMKNTASNNFIRYLHNIEGLKPLFVKFSHFLVVLLVSFLSKKYIINVKKLEVLPAPVHMYKYKKRVTNKTTKTIPQLIMIKKSLL